MKIILFNVKFSPNLGDGLLSECLEKELRLSEGVTSARSLDLAGRDDYGASGRNRRIALAVLERLPRGVRAFAAGAALRRLVNGKLRPKWAPILKAADAVVIGGGNLFADVDTNFPYKLNGALLEAAAAGAPVFIAGVGVADNWSAKGSRLFLEGLSAARVVDVTARDARSCDIWNRLTPAEIAPRSSLALDPGLLTSKHFPHERPARADRTRIAVGLTDPLALRYHTPPGAIRVDMDRWFLDLVRALAREDREIALFTNGSPEDRHFLQRFTERLAREGAPGIRVEPAFQRPDDLARFVASQDLVVAHRMHACIAAYSYGVPTIGLTWDVKLKDFFALTERAGFLLDPGLVTIEEVQARADAALAEGVDEAHLKRLIARCEADIARLGGLIRSAARR